MNSDIESEPPPEPAPPEHFPPSHRDISMASINAITVKPPSNFVLKIDNGDLIHEEFVPQSQHGKFFLRMFFPRNASLGYICPRKNSRGFCDDAASRHEQ